MSSVLCPRSQPQTGRGSERFKHTTRPYKVEDVVKLQGATRAARGAAKSLPFEKEGGRGWLRN